MPSIYSKLKSRPAKRRRWCNHCHARMETPLRIAWHKKVFCSSDCKVEFAADLVKADGAIVNDITMTVTGLVPGDKVKLYKGFSGCTFKEFEEDPDAI